MNNQNQVTKLDASSSKKTGFKILLAGIVVLLALICNSCNPDDDDTGTDGTSGATSLNLTTPQTLDAQYSWNC